MVKVEIISVMPYRQGKNISCKELAWICIFLLTKYFIICMAEAKL